MSFTHKVAELCHIFVASWDHPNVITISFIMNLYTIGHSGWKINPCAHVPMSPMDERTVQGEFPGYVQAESNDRSRKWINEWINICTIFYDLLEWDPCLQIHACKPQTDVLCLCSCSSHLQFLLQFSSVIPSSSSPQMSTAEKINATRTAKQQTNAKITMHFCWDCRRRRERARERENNIDFRCLLSTLQHFKK